MMKRFIFLIYSFTAHFLYAQQDPVLLRINHKEITRSEFETAYNNYLSSVTYDKKNVNCYLTQFVDDKLKITEAETLGLDTTSDFQAKMQKHSKTLQADYMMERCMNDVLFHKQQQEASSLPEHFQIMQIFKYIPQNASKTEQENANRLMNQLYQELVSNPLADFVSYMEDYSDDKRCFEISRLEMNPEFEQIVFSMQKGEVSAPFFTPQGIHIVMIIDRRNTLPDHELREISYSRIKKRYKNEVDDAFLQKLKETYNYTPNLSGINKLLNTGSTHEILFTLNGRAYTSDEFHYFAATNPKRVSRQFEDFVAKSLMDCDGEQLVRQPAYQLSMKEYKNALLLSDITHREISEKAQTDRAGLTAYFSVNKKKYRWEYPRFRGVVLHARDKKILSEAKKLVKKRPVEEWERLITEFFNFGTVQQVQVEQDLFAVGDNAYVDDQIFKRGHVASPASYPFTAVIGKKNKGPKTYNEVLVPLTSDYEDFLEKQWITRLRRAYRVEINEEVLKTVNNH